MSVQIQAPKEISPTKLFGCRAVFICDKWSRIQVVPITITNGYTLDIPFDDTENADLLFIIGADNSILVELHKK